MKVLIFLFAMITFFLMAGDPRREDFETRESTKNKEVHEQNIQQQHQEDSGESS